MVICKVDFVYTVSLHVKQDAHINIRGRSFFNMTTVHTLFLLWAPSAIFLALIRRVMDFIWKPHFWLMDVLV